MARATKKFFEELRKEIMEGKTAQPDNAPTQAVSKEGEEYMKRLPYEMCESLMITIQNRNDEIARLQEENKKLKEQYERESTEWETFKNNKEEIVKHARIEAVRGLVENLIIYAEGEDKNVAREIKIALNAKMANGYIASDVLTDKWKQRLENLGREIPRNNNMNFQIK